MVIILYLLYIQNGAPKLLLMAQPLKHPQSESGPGGDYLSQWLGHLLVNLLHTPILAGRIIHAMHQIQINFGLDLPLLFNLHKIWSVDSQENH